MLIHSAEITGSVQLNNTDVSGITNVAGFASTGSNQFNGNQSISGSITSNGTITAQTLVVQTVTSSIEFVTGSTRNGSLAENTHQFTGSVYFSGSVGYGTSSPSYRLSLVSTPSSAGFDGINVTTGTADVIGLYRTGTSYSYGMVGANQSWIYSNYGDLNIVADAASANIKLGTSGGTARLFISGSGRVSIGTTSSPLNSQFSVVTQNAGGIMSYFLDSPGDTALYWYSYSSAVEIEARTSNNLTYRNIVLAPNGGNVGIGLGASMPSTTLQVNGTITANRFTSAESVVAIPNSATTIFDATGQSGVWLVTAVVQGNGIQAGYAIVGLRSESTLYLLASGAGGQMTFSVSGATLRLSQSAGGTINTSISVMKINQGG